MTPRPAVPSTDPSKVLVERYDREAAAYAELWAPVLRTASRRLLPRMAGSRVDRVLDLGTGVGTLLPDLTVAFPRARIIGVDRSRGMLSLAPPAFPRLAMDANHLAIRDDCMDRVLVLFMLFHLDEPARGLREARRVLRRGGQIGTITWGSELECPASRVWTECLDAHGADPSDPAVISRHDRTDTEEKVATMVVAAGFGDLDCWTEELVHRFDVDSLLRLRTSLGSMKPRFESLAPDAREACVSEARRRMSALPPEGLLARARLVHSVAHA